ncbi:hypothetical protein SLS62_009025 [Diatrype stigma]|uniref:Uncharacterized protein n=1 Tax=Diatrype stigma TaxID=117547 RepID=A0AAN9UPE3_9PEZI
MAPQDDQLIREQGDQLLREVQEESRKLGFEHAVQAQRLLELQEQISFTSASYERCVNMVVPSTSGLAHRVDDYGQWLISQFDNHRERLRQTVAQNERELAEEQERQRRDRKGGGEGSASAAAAAALAAAGVVVASSSSSAAQSTSKSKSKSKHKHKNRR